MKVLGICEGCGQKQKIDVDEKQIPIQNLTGDEYLGFRALRWLFYVVICWVILGYANCMVGKHYDVDRIQTFIKDPNTRVRYYSGNDIRSGYWQFYRIKKEEKSD